MASQDLETSPSQPAWSIARRVVVAFVVLGLAWRVVYFLRAQPVTGDEAAVMVQLVDAPLGVVLRPLAYNQVAPVLFMVAQRAAMLGLGHSEYAIRALPLAAGCLGLIGFAVMAVRCLPPWVAVFSTAVLASSKFAVAMCGDAKPYSLDLLMAVLIVWLTLLAWRSSRAWPAIVLGVMLPVALGLSFAAFFVGVAGCLVLGAAWVRRSPGNVSGVGVGVAAAGLVVGSVGLYAVTRAQYASTTGFMTSWWREAFPPADAMAFVKWAVRVHTGPLFAYPSGGESGGSTASLVLFLLGLVALRSRGRWPILMLVVTPFVLTFLAACGRYYPYGVQPRISQHLVPGILIGMGFGLESIRVWIAARHRRLAALFAVGVLVLFCAMVVYEVARVGRKARGASDGARVRLLATAWAAESHRGWVAVNCDAGDLPITFRWYFRALGADVLYRNELPTAGPAGRPLLVVRFAAVRTTYPDPPLTGYREPPTGVESFRLAVYNPHDADCTVTRYDAMPAP